MAAVHRGQMPRQAGATGRTNGTGLFGARPGMTVPSSGSPSSVLSTFDRGGIDREVRRVGSGVPGWVVVVEPAEMWRRRRGADEAADLPDPELGLDPEEGTRPLYGSWTRAAEISARSRATPGRPGWVGPCRLAPAAPPPRITDSRAISRTVTGPSPATSRTPRMRVCCRSFSPSGRGRQFHDRRQSSRQLVKDRGSPNGSGNRNNCGRRGNGSWKSTSPQNSPASAGPHRQRSGKG